MAFRAPSAIRAFVAPSVRSMSTAPSVSVDWGFLRGKMITDAGRANIERARESFKGRLAAAQEVGRPAEIDWAGYQEKLPDLDIAAVKAAYEAYMEAIPDIPYDEAADLAAHSAEESRWDTFSAFCAERVSELEAAQAESKEHALSDEYTLNRLFQRFDGLYEAEWARIQNCDFFSNLDTPDVSEEMPEAQKRDLLVEIQSQSGLPASAFGARE